MKKIKLTESYLHDVITNTLNNVIKEDWNDDRFEYNHFSDEGNGGIEEYALNIANIIQGIAGDPDSVHAVAEETAMNLIDNNNDALKWFIEGLIAVYKNPNHPYDVYGEYGIERK